MKFTLSGGSQAPPLVEGMAALEDARLVRPFLQLMAAM
jgi:hypothetical protein